MYYGARGIGKADLSAWIDGEFYHADAGVGFIPAHAGIRARNEKGLQAALTVILETPVRQA
jgi:hypothetical protein